MINPKVFIYLRPIMITLVVLNTAAIVLLYIILMDFAQDLGSDMANDKQQMKQQIQNNKDEIRELKNYLRK